LIESLLVAVTRVSTMAAEKPLTNATGFFSSVTAGYIS
jgi:hypothetical protein